MIRHIVFFSAKEPQNRDAIFDGLSLLKKNPHAQHIEIARNMHVDAITGVEIDFVVYSEFADEAALAEYKAHHTYQDSIDIVRPLRELRIAADFPKQP